MVRQKALEREERDWRERMDTKPKLDTYKRWKLKLEYEPYLNIRDSSSRRALTELRSGTHRLRIETGRWERIPVHPSVSNGHVSSRSLRRSERICPMCFGGVESEMHFLLDCPMYDDQREVLLAELKQVEPWVASALEKHTNRTEIGIERRFEALRWLAQDKTILLVAQFIRNCNRIRRSFNN